jgi:hypothetical protein
VFFALLFHRVGHAYKFMIARCLITSWNLTKDATIISRRDHEKLRATGFDDKAILQITLIAFWFRYINPSRMLWA